MFWITISMGLLLLMGGKAFSKDCVPKSCTLPMTPGTCDKTIEAYYFDFPTGKCKVFNYTGCGGNLNRFRTLHICERICLKAFINCGANFTPTLPQSDVPIRCSLSRDSGPCRAVHERFYFDITSGKCLSFIYGGCQGNLNNFHTQEQCEATCMKLTKKI